MGCICSEPSNINVYEESTDLNTPYYTYEHMKKTVKVLRVIDGDTLDIALYHADIHHVYKHRVRLYGIDTPEKKPLKSNANRDAEIAAAKIATDAMTKKLLENNNIVVALFYKPDKYGRLLCTLYDKEGNDINKWMITEGYAVEYFGKTKKHFLEKSAQKTDNIEEKTEEKKVNSI